MIPYLQVEDLTKHYGEIPLFENLSFSIMQDQKVALIAKNGTGKSTLMNLITGVDTPETGVITFPNHISVGYLRQIPDLDPNLTVFEQAYNSSSELVQTIRKYEEAIHSGDHQQMQDAMEKMDQHNAWDFELRIKQILTELKITNLDQKISQLSGGQQKRVAMANVLINEPDLLIMDEPTNHLDLEMIEWLEVYLKKTKSTLFMVTHDRYFLDRVCNEILELEDRTTYRYKGNYSYYLEKREERIAQQTAEVEKARNLMRTELEWMRRMPKARGHKAKFRVDNFHQLKDKAKQRRVEKEVELNIGASRLGNKVIEIEGLSKKFGDLKILEDFTYKFSRFEKVGIVGENGTGKTTFLNLITGQLPADGGTVDIGETVRVGYYAQSGMKFKEDDKVLDVIKEIAEVIELGNGSKLTASQFLGLFLFPPEVQHTHVAKLSGGEKRRLYLCTVLMRNPNFLILDEPTNDLDIMTLNVLEDYLSKFNGCVVIVSHDRYFMDKIVDHLFVFEGQGIVRDFPGNYSIYRDWKDEKEKEAKKAIKSAKPAKEKPVKEKTRKLSFKEKKELEELEISIADLESEKEELEEAMNSGNLSPDDLVEKSKRHGEIVNLLDEKEFRWLELSEIDS